jgi:hypothetical protein
VTYILTLKVMYAQLDALHARHRQNMEARTKALRESDWDALAACSRESARIYADLQDLAALLEGNPRYRAIMGARDAVARKYEGA